MATEKVDLVLSCVDCENPFEFTIKDQDYYQEKGFTEPRRCKPCRSKRKADRVAAEKLAGASEKRTFHKAVCADCGQEISVPFVPIPHRPVFCKSCFLTNRKTS